MPSKDSSLDSWLEYISGVHPREIDLGLDRIARVAGRLLTARPAKQIITVAGTNGKGSNVAAMEAVLLANNYSVAAFTSPHIHCFNERIRVNGKSVSDDVLIDGLIAIEANRSDESLSYFEYSALLAFYIFSKADMDVALLEVGLGGRLDAVNLIDADIAVISSIALDHQDWLGSDLDGIAAEKAGIIREGKPVVCSEENPRSTILERAELLSSKLYIAQQHFSLHSEVGNNAWKWQGQDQAGEAVHCGAFTNRSLHPSNLASALQTLALLPLELDWGGVPEVLDKLNLAGRFELCSDRKTSCPVVFDVAHNGAAANLLSANLLALKAGPQGYKSIAVVLAVMADKDVEEMVSALESCSDIWYIAQVDEARSMSVTKLYDCLIRRPFFQQENRQLECFNSVSAAYEKACNFSLERGLVLVTGSFLTVAAVRERCDTL